MALTPMMQQYLETKEQYPDAILLYRLGDFYEMFFEDAKIVSKELELTLTGKDCGLEERAPMCGVPFHSADSYIGRMVNHGHKVVICEQMEDASQAKGLVRREVTRIITPGTVIESSYLNDAKNNYISAICIDNDECGVCTADFSTGDIFAAAFYGKECIDNLINELGKYMPRELLINTYLDTVPKLSNFSSNRLSAYVTENRAYMFDFAETVGSVKERFGDAIPPERYSEHALISSVGAMLAYVEETRKSSDLYMKNLKIHTDGQYLEMDVNTRRNLELCETMRERNKKGTLLWVLDETETAMGTRLLRKWIEQPLVSVNAILRRQSAVAELHDSFMLREELSRLLADVLDVERLMSRVVYGSANGKDLRALCRTFELIPQIKMLISESESEELKRIYNDADDLCDLYELLDRAIVEEPPFSIREGGFIREGYNEEVDRLNDIRAGGQEYKSKIEERERESTGIKSLKVGYNKVYGFYIEVSKTNLADVPDRFIRKQTLTNTERYITQELKELENEFVNASDKVVKLEAELLFDICDKLSRERLRIQRTAASLAELDVYLSLARAAVNNSYIRPDVLYTGELKIKEGRHPVVEKFVKDGYFVPNDTCLDTGFNKMMLITGPNMAGKSTYMRQVALITIMAQIGSFVPAADAEIGIVDKIFTRVGASDDLASGSSTFMLEMTEVAYILKHATSKSLIIYDEIGRGTSTFDGMSIAKAVAEFTAGKKIGAKSLFATHYHELTELENEVEGIVNYYISAKKKGDDIIFLRKILRGAADDSYGIEVAKLAGIPNQVIKRSKEVLASLVDGKQRFIKQENTNSTEPRSISLTEVDEKEAADILRRTDTDSLSPLEALQLVYELKKILK